MGISIFRSGPNQPHKWVGSCVLTSDEVEAIHFTLKQTANRWRSDDPRQHESRPSYIQTVLVERLERQFYEALKAWKK